MPVLVRINFLNVASILAGFSNKQQTVAPNAEEKTVLIPKSDYFSDAINKVNPSIVAIQSFYNGQLARHGSGIILTQDGLIATLNSLVPSYSSLFQVTQDGKIYKAKIIFRNYTKNVAIISIPETDLQVANLKPTSPNLGQDLLILSRLVNFSKDNPFVEEALVSQVSDNGQFQISSQYNQDIYGAALMDNEGQIFGILDFGNQKPVIVTSEIIEGALTAALTKL